MTTRQDIGSGVVSGALVPKKHDLVLIKYTDKLEHYGYYGKTTFKTVFIARVERECNTDGRLVREELFKDIGPFKKEILP